MSPCGCVFPKFVDIKVLDGFYTEDDLKPQTLGSAGIDLKARVEEDICAYTYNSVLIPTGIRMSIPKGYVGKLYIRSGLSKYFMLANGTGIIDSDYRGEIKVRLVPYGDIPNGKHTICRGIRIAQLIIEKLPTNLEYRIVESLDTTERGEGGFGSTGK